MTRQRDLDDELEAHLRMAVPTAWLARVLGALPFCHVCADEITVRSAADGSRDLRGRNRDDLARRTSCRVSTRAARDKDPGAYGAPA